MLRSTLTSNTFTSYPFVPCIYIIPFLFKCQVFFDLVQRVFLIWLYSEEEVLPKLFSFSPIHNWQSTESLHRAKLNGAEMGYWLEMNLTEKWFQDNSLSGKENASYLLWLKNFLSCLREGSFLIKTWVGASVPGRVRLSETRGFWSEKFPSRWQIREKHKFPHLGYIPLEQDQKKWGVGYIPHTESYPELPLVLWEKRSTSTIRYVLQSLHYLEWWEVNPWPGVPRIWAYALDDGRCHSWKWL